MSDFEWKLFYFGIWWLTVAFLVWFGIKQSVKEDARAEARNRFEFLLYCCFIFLICPLVVVVEVFVAVRDWVEGLRK